MKKMCSFILLTLLPCLAFSSLILGEEYEFLKIDGQTRSFLVHDFSHVEKAALVIVLHAGGDNGKLAASQTNFDQVAEREGLIVVYPDGLSDDSDGLLPTWNAAHCCNYAMQQDIDDVEFIRQMIDYLITTRNVDPTQVFVTGLSNGGMLAHRLGYELPDKITAIAPIISSMFGDEPLRKFPMPVLTINGNLDSYIKVQGGDLNEAIRGNALNSSADKPTQSISSQGEYWSKVNGCTAFSDSDTSNYSLRTYTGCRNGGAVENVVVKGMGHTWPGATSAFDGTEVIWAFFKRFHLSAAIPETNNSYYFDGSLVIPALESGSSVYRAKLRSLGGNPTKFEVTRPPQALAGTLQHNNHYANGVLTLTPVVIGDKSYQVELLMQKAQPLTFQLNKLTPILP